MPKAHASCLVMLDAGDDDARRSARCTRRAASCSAAGDLLEQPGLVRRWSSIRDEGAATVYTGSIAASLLELMAERDGSITAGDLASYAVAWSEPTECAFAGRRVLHARRPVGRSGHARAVRPGRRRRRAARGARAGRDARWAHHQHHRGRQRRAMPCVLTSSLGLGSGDWLPGLDLHLNSMLGETDLIREPLEPEARMASMMAPTLVFDGRRARAGDRRRGRHTAAHRARSACWPECCTRASTPQAAIDRPRFHPAGHVLNAEPGVDERWLARLEARGREVRRWPDAAPLLRRRQRGRSDGARRRPPSQRRREHSLSGRRPVRRGGAPLSSPRRRGRSGRPARPRSRRPARREAAARARRRAGRRRGRRSSRAGTPRSGARVPP